MVGDGWFLPLSMELASDDKFVGGQGRTAGGAARIDQQGIGEEGSTIRKMRRTGCCGRTNPRWQL